MPKTTLPILSGRSWHPASTQYCVTLRGPLKLALIWHSLVLAVHSSSAGDGLSMQTKYLYLCNVCSPKKLNCSISSEPCRRRRFGSDRVVLDWIGLDQVAPTHLLPRESRLGVPTSWRVGEADVGLVKWV